MHKQQSSQNQQQKTRSIKPIYEGKLSQILKQTVLQLQIGQGATFVACVLSRGYYAIKHLDKYGKQLDKLITDSTQQPKLALLSPHQPILLTYKQERIANELIVWNTKNKKILALKLSSQAEQKQCEGYRVDRLFVFKESGLICYVWYCGVEYRVMYFRLVGEEIEVVCTSSGRLQGGPKMRWRQLDHKSSIAFFKLGFQPGQPIIVNQYSLQDSDPSIQQQPISSLKPTQHIFPVAKGIQSLPYSKFLKLGISDICRLSQKIIYIQIWTHIDKETFWEKFEFDMRIEELISLEKYADYLWEYQSKEQKQTVQKLENCNKSIKITDRAHRIQFVDNIRELSIDRDEGRPTRQRINAPVHLTGYHANYFLYQLDVPIYLYNLPSTRILATLPPNVLTYNYYKWSVHRPDTFIYIMATEYQVWKLPLNFVYCVCVIAVFFMGSLVEECDEDLLEQVARLVQHEKEEQKEQAKFIARRPGIEQRHK